MLRTTPTVTQLLLACRPKNNGSSRGPSSSRKAKTGNGVKPSSEPPCPSEGVDNIAAAPTSSKRKRKGTATTAASPAADVSGNPGPSGTGNTARLTGSVKRTKTQEAQPAGIPPSGTPASLPSPSHDPNPAAAPGSSRRSRSRTAAEPLAGPVLTPTEAKAAGLHPSSKAEGTQTPGAFPVGLLAADTAAASCLATLKHSPPSPHLQQQLRYAQAPALRVSAAAKLGLARVNEMQQQSMSKGSLLNSDMGRGAKGQSQAAQGAASPAMAIFGSEVAHGQKVKSHSTRRSLRHATEGMSPAAASAGGTVLQLYMQGRRLPVATLFSE